MHLQNSKSEEDKEEWQRFFRKGGLGDWKNYFQGENLKTWDEWIEENLAGTDITLTLEWVMK